MVDRIEGDTDEKIFTFLTERTLQIFSEESPTMQDKDGIVQPRYLENSSDQAIRELGIDSAELLGILKTHVKVTLEDLDGYDYTTGMGGKTWDEWFFMIAEDILSNDIRLRFQNLQGKSFRDIEVERCEAFRLLK